MNTCKKIIFKILLLSVNVFSFGIIKRLTPLFKKANFLNSKCDTSINENIPSLYDLSRYSSYIYKDFDNNYEKSKGKE